MFLVELLKSNTAYKEKLSARSTPEKTMLELLWDIDTLKQLNDKGRALVTDIAVLLDLLQQSEVDQTRCNLPQKLSGVRDRLQEIIKGVYRFRRVPASHVFV